MRMFWQKSEKRAQQDFGDAVAAALAARASDGAGRLPSQTAAAAFSIGMIARAFALALPEGLAIPPDVLATIGRNLALTGNAIFDLRTDMLGAVTWIPATGWEITGGPDPVTWTYTLTLPGPSADQEVQRAGTDVIHIRQLALPESPWAGRSPLSAAGFSADLLAAVEERMAQETTARVGQLLVTPPLSEASRTNLRADLKGAKGNIIMLGNEGNYPARSRSGSVTAPDFKTLRFGPDVPDGNIRLREDVGGNVVSAYGIPHSLWSGGEGSASRESWRQFTVAMQSLGELVAGELSAKLERDVSLSFRRLAAIDISARARAAATLARAGVDLDDALAAADLGD